MLEAQHFIRQSNLNYSIKDRRTRKAEREEFDAIFMMGIDAWSSGTVDEYLTTCYTSQKYKQGCWYVLDAGEGVLVSSLIVYKIDTNTYGIGSIATPKELRNQGHATKLISDVIQDIEQKSPEAIIFIYSDIHPEFYKRFNFIQLSISAQRYTETTCMVRGKSADFFTDNASTPKYF